MVLSTVSIIFLVMLIVILNSCVQFVALHRNNYIIIADVGDPLILLPKFMASARLNGFKVDELDTSSA